MKKNLIVALALVFVLGIAGTAFAAANPFVDVPAKHWAYDAVSKLAKAGILDGYGDGTYRGERLASRYEMAQATAKAMARADKADAQMKALIDKLAVEFAAELNNLGVRVAKLEKNASSIKFWGDARIRYQANTNFATETAAAQNRWQQRIRVYAQADLNDKVQFMGRMTYQNTAFANNAGSMDVEPTGMQWGIGQFTFKQSPTTSVTIGRMSPYVGNGLIIDNDFIDGAVVNFGDPLKVQIGYADVTRSEGYGYKDSATSTLVAKYAYWMNLSYQANKDWNLVGALYSNADLNVAPYTLYALGFNANLNKDFKLYATYAWNAVAEDKLPAYALEQSRTAWAAQLQYKGADKAKVGTWGLYATYRDVKPYALDSAIMGGPVLANDIGYTQTYGMKGWGFKADYTLSKNVVLGATYYSYSRNLANDTTNVAPAWYFRADMWF